ncbi:MAG: phosphotransferase [Candidatus Sericytochromatia bacterium]|nr:phosphotransferase [Candidatus Sericytochromatia bacterium]
MRGLMARDPAGFVRSCFPDLEGAEPAGWPRRLTNSHIWWWHAKGGQRFLVKWRPGGVVGPVGLKTSHQAADHLRRTGLPVPLALAGRDGKPWVLQQQLLVEAWLAGEGTDTYADRDPFDPLVHPHHAHAIGAFLGRARHHAPACTGHRPTAEPGVWADTAWLDGAAPEAGPLVAPRPFQRAAWTASLPILQRLLNEHPWPKGPPEWHHGDPLPRNMLFRNLKVSGLFDFEGWTTAPRAFDLALATAALAFPWPRLAAGAPARPEVARLLRGGWASSVDLPEWSEQLPLIIFGRVGSAFRRAGALADVGLMAEAHRFLEGMLTVLRWWEGPEGRSWRGREP